jgi:hypothetical protein
MRSLKGLVIAMGVFIILGTGLLVYGLVQRASDPGFSFFGKAPAPAAQPATIAGSGPAGATPFGDVTVRLPAGCEVVDMKPDGDRLFVRVGPAAGACSQIVVVELASGRVLGNVKFWSAP